MRPLCLLSRLVTRRMLPWPAGKIRFLGFSAHSVEAALALIEGFAFDTILFPIN